MNILIAPNAFKHSATAGEAAEAIAEGFRRSRLACSCELFPVGDGGDGTAGLIAQKCGGVQVSTVVHDALGRSIETHFGLIDGGNTAVIEMADASGLRLLKQDELNPLIATSFGTGEQIIEALNRGTGRIVIGMGGSATVDGGTGMLKALGVRFLDAAGIELQTIPADLTSLAAIDLSGMDKRIFDTRVTVLCDVDNFLCGPQGAAAMFGPQKGADAVAVQHLDNSLARLSAVALQLTGRDMAGIKYGGTAGGASAGLYALLGAELVNGIEHFLDLTGFETALKKADWVVTGEGSIDEQTLQGKGPFGVARRAKLQGLPVIGIAGKVPLEKSAAMDAYFDVLLPLSHQPLTLPEALAATNYNLVRTACEAGNLLAAAQTPVRRTEGL